MSYTETINALECCARNSDTDAYCHECPYSHHGVYCLDKLLADALTLIKRQQERITILESGVMTTKAWEDIMRNALSPLVAKIAEDQEAKYEWNGVRKP